MSRLSSHRRLRACQSDQDFIYVPKIPKTSPVQSGPTEESSPPESPKPIMIFEFDKVSSKEEEELDNVFEEIQSWCFSLRFSTGGDMLYELGKLAPPPVFEGTPRPNKEVKAMMHLLESRFTKIVTESINPSTPQPLSTPSSTPINPSTPQPLSAPNSTPINLHKPQLINPSTTLPLNTQRSTNIKPPKSQPPQQTIQEEDNEGEGEEDEEEYLPTTFKSKLINPLVFRFNPFPFEQLQPQPPLNPTHHPAPSETPQSPISQPNEPNEPEELSYYNKKIIENSKIPVSQPLCLPYVFLQPYWFSKPAIRPPLKSSSKPFFESIESSSPKSLAFSLFEPEGILNVRSETLELSPTRSEAETACQKTSKPVHLSIPKRIKYPTPKRINRQAPKRSNHPPIKSTHHNRQPLNPSTAQPFKTQTKSSTKPQSVPSVKKQK